MFDYDYLQRLSKRDKTLSRLIKGLFVNFVVFRAKTLSTRNKDLFVKYVYQTGRRKSLRQDLNTLERALYNVFSSVKAFMGEEALDSTRMLFDEFVELSTNFDETSFIERYPEPVISK